MLDQTFGQVYTKFKLHFYKQIFSRFEDREATLTTVESFCMEVIMALGEPTIAQFSHMMNLSTPNAAYKINSLVKKGYVERIQSTTDKREYRLRPTQKYIDYYNISYSYLHLVMERAKQRFSPDDLAKLEEMLQIVSDELMPEIPAVTTRGFNTDDMDQVAEAIALMVNDPEANKEKATAIVKSLTDKYPLYE